MAKQKIRFEKSSSTTIKLTVDGEFRAWVHVTRMPRLPTGRPAHNAYEVNFGGRRLRATELGSLRSQVTTSLDAA